MESQGLCECGCGGETSIAPKNSPRFGWIKGEPLRYILGHATRGKRMPNWKGGRSVNGEGYILIRARRGSPQKFEHRVIAEKALGKPLPEGAVVHHHGGETSENHGNLVLCQDAAYHSFLHIRTRALHACGNANYRKCLYCKQHDDPANLKTSGKEHAKNYFHADCRNAYNRVYLKKGRMAICM